MTRLSVVLPGQSSDAGGLALTAEETATPELEVLGAASQEPPHSGRAAEQEATTAQALFPIFRPRNQRKCILLVRHGESSERLCRPRGGGRGGWLATRTPGTAHASRPSPRLISVPPPF